jgi:hypothetical protein
MSTFGSLTNALFGSAGTNNVGQNVIAQNTGAMLGQGQLIANQAQWNAAQGMQNSYPYAVSQYRALHLVVKQVENGYTVEIGGSTHIASDLKEITDLLTNRVAATLLEWNP